MIRNVLIFSTQTRSDKTGVRVFCDSLERNLDLAGVRVVRLSHHDCSGTLKNISRLLLKASRVFGRGFQQVMSRWAIYWQAWGALRTARLPYDTVVFAQDPITGAAACRFGYKTFSVCHFSDPIVEILKATPMGAISRFLIRRSMFWFMRKNQRFCVLTKSVEAIMREYLGVDISISYVPTICRIESFTSNVPHDGFKIVMAGRLEHLKGQERLIVALQYLKRADVSLVLLGDGPDKERLENLAAECGVLDKVVFMGFVSHPETCYKYCDLYIHSSQMECLPLTPIEAIFCGVPAWCYQFDGYNDTGVFDETPELNDLTRPMDLAGHIDNYFNHIDKCRYQLLQRQRGVVGRFVGGTAIKEYLALCEKF